MTLSDLNSGRILATILKINHRGAKIKVRNGGVTKLSQDDGGLDQANSCRLVRSDQFRTELTEFVHRLGGEK